MIKMLNHRLSLSLLLIVLRATTAAEQPVCSSADGRCSSSKDGEDRDEQCKLYYDEETDWMFSGQDVKRGDVAVDWQDVVIHFTQHDRRAWPLWSRYSYFHQIPNKPYEFIFAPGVHTWTNPHQRLGNLANIDDELIALAKKTVAGEVTKVGTNPPLVANRRIQTGDPIFYTSASTPDRSDDFDIRLVPQRSAQVIQENGECISAIATGPSTIEGVEQGVFATQPFDEGDVVSSTIALHLHRSELYNATGDYHEELLNYCYGHPNTDLLLLPFGAVVNSINHASAPNTANIKIKWNESPNRIKKLFSKKFYSFVGKEETALLSFAYYATRPIKAGDELLIDYGKEFDDALKQHQSSIQSGDEPKPFRHEIGLDIFPAKWISKEERIKTFPTWDGSKLKAGEIQRARLEDGREPADHIFRIGLPEGLSYKMKVWSDEMGITELMESWLQPGNLMKINSEERVRINGGNWWLKRFSKEWESNLYYICPDDDVANEQFMHALGEAGWDTVLEAIGTEVGLDSLSMYYPTFIAMTHSQSAYMHSDSDYKEIFNVLFPVVQSNATNSAGADEAEVILGMDPDKLDDDEVFNVPYKYEPDHAVALGKDGMHGTAPGDFRGSGHFRMVVSVYMGDFKNDKVLDHYVDTWQDPPYPRPWNLRRALKERKHWDANDPSVKSSLPQKNFV